MSSLPKKRVPMTTKGPREHIWRCVGSTSYRLEQLQADLSQSISEHNVLCVRNVKNVLAMEKMRREPQRMQAENFNNPPSEPQMEFHEGRPNKFYSTPLRSNTLQWDKHFITNIFKSRWGPTLGCNRESLRKIYTGALRLSTYPWLPKVVHGCPVITLSQIRAGISS